MWCHFPQFENTILASDPHVAVVFLFLSPALLIAPEMGETNCVFNPSLLDSDSAAENRIETFSNWSFLSRAGEFIMWRPAKQSF